MRIESIKNVNITLIFSEQLNHLLISQKNLLEGFKLDSKDKHSFIEAPGLKVLILPEQQKEIAFEANRILVNDKSGSEIEKTSVVGDLQVVLSSDAVNKEKISAYGFNFDAIVVPEDDNFSARDLVSDKVAGIGNIKNVGISMLLEKNGLAYILELKPIKNDKKFIGHFNAHYNSGVLPLKEKLADELKLGFKELINVLQKI